jgi:hypothetical protein
MRSLTSRASLRYPVSGAGTGASCLLDLRHRICYGARGQDGFRDATREEERRRAPHLREVVPIGSPCEQRRTCWGSERLHFAPGPQPFLTGRAIRVPHRRVDPGTQRTTTVTSTPPTSWSSSPDQQERIPRMCLIRMCSSLRPGGCLEDVPRDNDGHQRSTAVYPNFGHDQRKRRDQHRLSAQSLDGMQGVRGSNPLSSTRHNASPGLPLKAVCQQIVSGSRNVRALTL